MKSEKPLCSLPEDTYELVMKEVARTMFVYKHETVGNIPNTISDADLRQKLTGYCKINPSLVVLGDGGEILCKRIKDLVPGLHIVAYTSETVKWGDTHYDCNRWGISELIEEITLLEH
jgi:hypothetical protein